MSIWQAFGTGFFVTLGVEVALGLCYALGTAIKGANKR